MDDYSDSWLNMRRLRNFTKSKENVMKQFFHKFIAALLFVFGVGAVHASPSYCNAGPGDLDTATNADGLSVFDTTYNGGNSNDCYGVVLGNDSTSVINTLNWGSDWQLAAKDDIGGPDSSNTVLGISFSLTGSAGTDGTWTLTGVDSNGLSPMNLGDTWDFVAVLKASDRFAAYLFENVGFSGDAGGTWVINFENNGGQTPALSHLTVYAREGDFPVPAPETLPLMGIGFIAIGLAGFRRKRT